MCCPKKLCLHSAPIDHVRRASRSAAAMMTNHDVLKECPEVSKPWGRGRRDHAQGACSVLNESEGPNPPHQTLHGAARAEKKPRALAVVGGAKGPSHKKAVWPPGVQHNGIVVRSQSGQRASCVLRRSVNCMHTTYPYARIINIYYPFDVLSPKRLLPLTLESEKEVCGQGTTPRLPLWYLWCHLRT